MQTKIKILIIVLVICAAIAAAVYFFAGSNNTSAPAQTSQQQTSTGSGTVGTLPPLQTTTGRNLPLAHVDATQPFAVNLPRSNEPASPTNTNPGQTQSPQQAVQEKVNMAVDAGLIPGADGLYKQNVQIDGVSNYDAGKYNYALSPNDFASRYYPNYQQVAAFGVQTSDTTNDHVLIDSAPKTTVPTSVPTVSNFDPKLFKTTSDNTQSDKAYISNLSSVLAPLNIVGDPSIMTEITVALNNDPAAMQMFQKQTTNTLASLKSMTVPQSMLGLQQSYYLSYTVFLQFLNDNIAYSTAVAKGDQGSASILNKIQIDSDMLARAVGDTVDRTSTAQQILSPMGIDVTVLSTAGTK